LEELEQSKGDYGCNGLEKILKLYTTNTTTNMHLFDAKNVLRKYDTVTDIIDAYYVTRLDMYRVRKEYMITSLEKDLVKLSNKARYIMETLAGTLDMRNQKKETIFELLESKGYVKEKGVFDYLTKMPMDSVTEENVNNLLKHKKNTEAELEEIRITTTNQQWINELTKFKEMYMEYIKDRNTIDKIDTSVVPKKKIIIKKKTVINIED
jgi:DNA topoisomerase-2